MQVARGSTVTLTAVYRDGNLQVAEPVSPLVDILDADGVTVVNDAVPVEDSLGHFHYDYAVAADAELGDWSIIWSGTVDGSPVSAAEVFTVVAAGGVSPSNVGGACQAWCTYEGVIACASDLTGEDDAVQTGIAVATDILFQLSGLRFTGGCTEDHVRPVMVEGAGNFCGDKYIRDAILQGRLYAYDYRGCADHGLAGCGCNFLQQVRLGGYPVTHVSEVIVDGATLAPGTYEVLDQTWLVRTDDGVFPCCQDPTEPTTELGTFEVSYSYGLAPPPAGVRAAERLAAEVARACVGSAACQLPERVTTIVRQGATLAMLDPQDFLDHGRTGLYLVDLFLKAYNPQDLRGFSTIASPDYRRTGWRVS